MGLHGGVSGIGSEDQREHNTQRRAHCNGQAVVISVEDRLKDADEQHAAQSETDGAGRTDVPVHIAHMPAVIPPADAPFPFEPDA